MTIVVGAFEARAKFAELLDRVERGEDVVITRRGREVARLVGKLPRRTPEEAERMAKELLELGRQGGARLKELGIKATSTDHDELFYDERGWFK